VAIALVFLYLRWISRIWESHRLTIPTTPGLETAVLLLMINLPVAIAGAIAPNFLPDSIPVEHFFDCGAIALLLLAPVAYPRNTTKNNTYPGLAMWQFRLPPFAELLSIPMSSESGQRFSVVVSNVFEDMASRLLVICFF
jgi:hypothetical protein